MTKKPPNIDDMLADGTLKYGNNSSLILERIPSGIPELDVIMNGGIPRGRLTILVGEYSSGKSLLTQIFIKSAQETGLTAAYVDTEQTYDPVWWRQIGVDVDKLIVAFPATGEETSDLVAFLCEQKIDLIVIDSLAGMTPASEAEEPTEKIFIGLRARVLNRMLLKLRSLGHNSAIVCTNQLRDVMGPGPIDTMPGGRGQTFFSHLILRTKREGWLEEQGNRVGFNIRVVCRKSKVGTPFGECLLPFYFRGEIDQIAMLVDRAIEAGLIRQQGVWYSLPGQEEKLQGKNTVIVQIRLNPELIARLEGGLKE